MSINTRSFEEGIDRPIGISAPLRGEWAYALLMVAVLSVSQELYNIVGTMLSGNRMSASSATNGLTQILAANAPIIGTMLIGFRLLPSSGPIRWLALLMGTILTCALGDFLQAVLRLNEDYNLDSPWSLESQSLHLRNILSNMFPSALMLVVYEFHRRRVSAFDEILRLRARRAALEAELSKARVQLLAAQIEPHFLFNTLANLRRLGRTDTQAWRSMLSSLIRFLEFSLPSLRKNSSTLEDEVVLLTAYLELHRVRMGVRLQYSLEFPPQLASAVVPPMMLLTLIENAIKHGLAPLPEGGRLQISAEISGSNLKLKVADTGVGIGVGSGAGVGLANVRVRLEALYGDRASLTLQPNKPRGFIASLSLPLHFDRVALA